MRCCFTMPPMIWPITFPESCKLFWHAITTLTPTYWLHINSPKLHYTYITAALRHLSFPPAGSETTVCVLELTDDNIAQTKCFVWMLPVFRICLVGSTFVLYTAYWTMIQTGFLVSSLWHPQSTLGWQWIIRRCVFQSFVPAKLHAPSSSIILM